MKKLSTRRGFTLIELLVVVIILGILAAIALPQYQKAVMKSRFASLKPIAKSVKDAQEMYYHRNGRYATQSELADLDVGIPQEASIDISADGKHQYIRANHTGIPHNSYTTYLDRSDNFAGNIYCEAYTGDANAEQLCVAEGGTAGPTNGNYTLYLLSGNGTGSFGASFVSATATECPTHNGVYLHAPPSECGVSSYSDGSSISYEVEVYGVPIGILLTEYDSSGNEVNQSFYTNDSLPGEKSLEQLCEDYPHFKMTDIGWQTVSCS